jgi:glucan phosphoethanolaminetransferase (alkaline phosphatase superfamily)
MVCLKYKNKKFICVKKSLLYSLLYVFLITTVLLGMDTLYALSNEYFIFKFTSKEFFNKIFLLILLISFISKPKIRLIIYFILISFSFFQYIHFEYFGKNIGAIEFYLFSNNIHEIFETMNSMMGIVVIPFFIYMGSFFLIYIIDSKIGKLTFKYQYSFFIFLLGLIYLFAQMFYLTNIHKGKLEHTDSKRLYPTTNRHSARNFFVSLNYFIWGILPQKILFHKKTFPILKKPTLENYDLNRTVIFVIGESLRYDTFSMDGNFTPKLQSLKNDDGFFFKKVYSGGTMTKVSISTLINRLKYPNGLPQIAEENNCLFRLAKENRFNTYLFSAQSSFHLQMLRDMICPKYIDKLITRDDFINYIKPTGYDEDLKTLLEYKNILKENTFLVLHQRGSHSPYNKQYSKSFDKYKPYENTAFYTDNSLYELIQYFKKSIDGEFFFIYVSDHGELLGKNGKKGHGHLVKEVYEVPFLMYTNSKNSEIKEKFKYIRNHYDISNYILFLLGYKADLIEDEDRRLYILNTDLDGFSGYGVIDINSSVESKIEIKRY